MGIVVTVPDPRNILALTLVPSLTDSSPTAAAMISRMIPPEAHGAPLAAVPAQTSPIRASPESGRPATFVPFVWFFPAPDPGPATRVELPYALTMSGCAIPGHVAVDSAPGLPS